MKTLELEIGGMSCGHCVGQVTKALAGIRGIVVKTVLEGHATVLYDPAIVTPQDILKRIEETGYEPQPLERVT
jgi:copper chaperone CopZ